MPAPIDILLPLPKRIWEIWDYCVVHQYSALEKWQVYSVNIAIPRLRESQVGFYLTLIIDITLRKLR